MVRGFLPRLSHSRFQVVRGRRGNFHPEAVDRRNFKPGTEAQVRQRGVMSAYAPVQSSER